jgi:hypothetical protein
VGFEDITWVKYLKSLGTDPFIAGYTVYHDFDLSAIDDDVRKINIIFYFFC